MNYDLKKLNTSIIYIERLCDGHHPRYNTILENDSIVNDPDFMRCMFFIKDILKDVYKNNGYIGKKILPIKKDFPLELLDKYEYKDDLYITKFVERLNKLAIDNNLDVNKIKYTKILKWLKRNGYLESKYIDECDKQCSVVTNLGKEVGIYNMLKKRSNNSSYLVVLYSVKAQEFIIDNIENILND